MAAAAENVDLVESLQELPDNEVVHVGRELMSAALARVRSRPGHCSSELSTPANRLHRDNQTCMVRIALDVLAKGGGLSAKLLEELAATTRNPWPRPGESGASSTAGLVSIGGWACCRRGEELARIDHHGGVLLGVDGDLGLFAVLGRGACIARKEVSTQVIPEGKTRKPALLPRRI